MSYQGIVFDVDGTVVREAEPIPGAAEGLRAAADAGLDRTFLSNNPTARPAAYEERFAEAGFAVDAEAVFTAGTLTTRYLGDEHADDALFVVGADGLRAQLADAGLSLTTEPRLSRCIAGGVSRRRRPAEHRYRTRCRHRDDDRAGDDRGHRPRGRG